MVERATKQMTTTVGTGHGAKSPSPPPPPPPSPPTVSPRVRPEERPEAGLVSTRAREILESMRHQREHFLASIQPTEAETAARRLFDKKSKSQGFSSPSPTNTYPSSTSSKPPLFTTSDAKALTKRLNDSINQRKERLARFSNEKQYQNVGSGSSSIGGGKCRKSPTESSSFVRKMTQSPHSLGTASTTESSSFYSSPTDSSSGYDSDGSAVAAATVQHHPYANFELPLPRHPNLEGILENSAETESEAGSDMSPSAGGDGVKSTRSFNTSLLSTGADTEEQEKRTLDWQDEEDSKSETRHSRSNMDDGDEDENSEGSVEHEVQVHTVLSDDETETEASKPVVGAPLMTLFGYTSFDESVTRPPLLVHCSSYSSNQDSSCSEDDNSSTPSRMRRLARSGGSVVSGLSTFSGPAMGPLGHTVEQRKKALLRTLSSTVAELERLKVDISTELSSVVSSHTIAAPESHSIQHVETLEPLSALFTDNHSAPPKQVGTAASSTYTSIGISSASSYSFSADGSETSGWISPDTSSKSSSLSAPTFKREKQNSVQVKPQVNETKAQSSSSPPAPSQPKKKANVNNPLGEMEDEDGLDAEPKLLNSPPAPCVQKEPPNKEKVSNSQQQKKKKTVKIRSPTRKTFSSAKKTTKLRVPGPKELAAISFPRGNLWNIARSSGLSFKGPVRVNNRKSVYRSADYIRLSSECKCGTRGGLLDLALRSGMHKTETMLLSPLRKLKPPRANGRQRWKLKARGGHYHLTVWTNFTKNLLSPSSIFRDLRPKRHTPLSIAEYEAARLLARRAKLKVGALGSFHYITNETRKESV
ncbi:hypothetical protein ACA910_021074 [Epithemia clementina (nom. ined.)]